MTSIVDKAIADSYRERMTAPAKPTYAFDPGKLREMNEPIQLTVEREINGNQVEHIPIPGIDPNSGQLDSNAPAGGYWSKDGIGKLTWWLRDYWTGGGNYRATALDASGNELKWRFVIPTKDHPPRQPPSPGTAAVPPPSQAQPAPAQQSQQAPMPGMMVQAPQMQPGASFQPWQQQQMVQPPAPWNPPAPAPQQQWNGFAPPQQGPQWSGGFGVGGGYSQPWGYGVQQPFGFRPNPSLGAFGGYDQFGFPIAQAPAAPAAPAAPVRDREAEDRLKALEAALQKAEIDKKEQHYAALLREQQLASERQMAELREEMRRSTEQKSSGDNDDTRRMREQLEREKEARHAAEMKALHDQLTAMAQAPKTSPQDDVIRQMQEDNRRRDEEMRRKEEQWQREKERQEQLRRDEDMRRDMKDSQRALEMKLAEATAQKGPDPIVEVMRETSRNQMEFQRQMTEMHRAQVDKMAAFTVQPTQLIQMMREGSSGVDQITRTLLPAVTGIVDMYRASTQNIVELAGGGGGSWVPGMVQEGLNKAAGIAKEVAAGRRDVAVSENKAKIAQAQAAEAMSRAQEAMARTRGGGGTAPPPAPVPPPAQVAGAGLSGAAPADEGARVIPIADAQAEKNAPSAKEAERFGPVWESVRRLRKGVDAYWMANKALVDEEHRAKGSDGEAIGISPGQAVDAVLQGVDKVAEAKAEAMVPAFRLYADERWGEFVDLLMPNAPAPYANEVVRIFSEELKDNDEDEDEDSDVERDPELKV